MDTIVVNKITTPESSKSELKTQKVTVNLKHIVALEKSSNDSSIITLSTGKSFPIADEYNFLRRQIGKKNCIRFIEVNKVVTFPSTTTYTKSVKMTITLDGIVSFEKTYLKHNPFRDDLSETGTIISLSTGTDITVSDDCKSVNSYIETSKNNNFWPLAPSGAFYF